MPGTGGDVDQLSALKSSFERHAANLAEMVRVVDNQLIHTDWTGPAADRFKGEWRGDFKRMLANLENALAEASAEISRWRDVLVHPGP